jgi:hypothetical protein
MFFRLRLCIAAFICALAFLGTWALGQTPTSSPPDFVWIEGEDPTLSDVTRHGWYDGVKKDTLSGEDWLSHFDARKPGTAEFQFDVARADRYTFWLRANPVSSKLSYRIDSGDWQAVDFAGDTRGRMNIASDNKPDLRFIAWVKVGQVELAAGTHTVNLRMESGPQNHGGIDCLVFTRIPFVPSGATKPTAASGPAREDQWFAVVMDDDAFSSQSIIDVSGLVEAPAGRHGFLKRNGAALEFESGSGPSQFWAINASPGSNWTPRQMLQAARWYRKHGINLVRQHTVIDAVGLLDEQGNFDSQRLDHYDRWFATLKKQGIYSTWSVIYPHHGRFLRKQVGIDPQLFAELDRVDESADGNRKPISVNDFINLDPTLQAVAWRYFDRLLGHVNPHTGLAYKDDPALAMLEFQNESNVFFFTLNVLAEPNKMPILSRRMRQGFHRFAIGKYGSEEKATTAWGGRAMQGDDWNGGELRLMGAHHWGSAGPLYEYSGQQQRAGDYIEFLTGIQRQYYATRQRQVRQAGFRGATVTTAWKSGGPAASMANLYADTVGDVIDRHNYFGGGEGGHRIVEGKVNHDSHLSRPGHGLLSMGLFQVADRPFAVSEWAQMPPNPWKAEAAPLMAFYGMGLQGWDVVYSFSMSSYRMAGGWHNLRKYVVETPHSMGQFPALAFAIHNRHIDAGDVIAARRLSKEDVFAGQDILGQSLAGGGHDTKELTGRLTTPPSALAVGRVTIDFVRKPTDSTAKPLAPYDDVVAKRITSNTGQLVWDYGHRHVEVRSAKTQAIVGFTGQQSYELPGVDVRLDTPFVSLIFTPLDNKDLVDSQQILITAMARDRQTGTRYNEDQSELLAIGGPPLLMEPVQATIRLKGSRPTSVRPCDLYGVPRSDAIDVAADGSFQIDGRSQTYYYEVRR